jgi:hypothetical protein
MKQNLSPHGNLVFGAIFMLTGAGIMAISAGVFPAALNGANAPLWLILAAGGVFFLAGLALAGQGYLPKPLLDLCVVRLVTLFALIPGWVAWGDGPRSFSASLGFFSGGFSISNISLGRIVFGFGALLLGLMALFFWLGWLRKLSWTGRGIVLLVTPLTGYLLLVVMPAEPRWPELKDDHERLARYALMIEDEGWLRHKGRGPIHWYYPPWRNIEQWTRNARGRLAATRTAPEGQAVLTIPRIAAPVIDGQIGEDEWRGALRLELEPQSLESTGYIASDGKFLYLAGDVPADTTSTGFDQFRFWFHIALSPWLENERAFVDKSGGVNVLRSVRFPWGDYPARARNDWNVYQNARGASGFAGHRRFELALELEEAAITPGVAFPAWLEIEGDPVHDAAGKFKARSNMGQAGRYEAPLWFRIEPRE